MMSREPSPLLRGFAGVLLGYVGLASIAGLAPMAAESAIGLERLLQPASFAPTPQFSGLQLGIAVVAGLLGGFLCRWVANSRRPVFVLAALIFTMSLFSALIALSVPQDPAPPRTGQESPEELRDHMLTAQPVWLALGVPLALTISILLGGSRRSLPGNLATAAR